MLHNIEVTKENFSETIEYFNRFLESGISDVSKSLHNQIEEYHNIANECLNYEALIQVTFSEEHAQKVCQLLKLKEELNIIEYQVYFNLGSKFSSRLNIM